jgi:demethyl-4-deoxygadusol synthase
VPRPIGTCFFINDLSSGELERALNIHQELCRGYQRAGDGQDMFTA